MMDGKSRELTFEEKLDICTVSKYIPKIFFTYKRKREKFMVEKPSKHHLYQGRGVL